MKILLFLILRFLWKYKIGAIIGTLYAIIAWILSPAVGCSFADSLGDVSPICSTIPLYEFLSSHSMLEGIAFWLVISSFIVLSPFWGIDVSSGSFLFLFISIIYLMFLGIGIEFGIKKLFHIIFSRIRK